MLPDTAHRPWPIPTQPWVMSMRWQNLLFMHWPVRPELLRPWLPPGLTLDCYDGWAWLAVVPFQMQAVRPRGVPALPWLSAFPELNLRTYVTIDGKPGVWFFSLDAANPLAVEGARALFHLRYCHAQMRCREWGGAIRYVSQRSDRRATPAAFVGSYRPSGAVFRSTPGSLEQFLTERYCLYAANRRGQLWRGEIHHAPWPLQAASAEIRLNSLPATLRLKLTEAPLLHFSRRIDVVAWLPERVR